MSARIKHINRKVLVNIYGLRRRLSMVIIIRDIPIWHKLKKEILFFMGHNRQHMRLA
jgi:hypothetical protein